MARARRLAWMTRVAVTEQKGQSAGFTAYRHPSLELSKPQADRRDPLHRRRDIARHGRSGAQPGLPHRRGSGVYRGLAAGLRPSENWATRRRPSPPSARTRPPSSAQPIRAHAAAPIAHGAYASPRGPPRGRAPHARYLSAHRTVAGRRALCRRPDNSDQGSTEDEDSAQCGVRSQAWAHARVPPTQEASV